MRPETACIHAGYEPGNGGARALPIYPSTTFTFESTEHVGALCDRAYGIAAGLGVLLLFCVYVVASFAAAYFRCKRGAEK